MKVLVLFLYVDYYLSLVIFSCRDEMLVEFMYVNNILYSLIVILKYFV